MPFLHYETLLGYDMMSKVISQVKKSRVAETDPSQDQQKSWTEVLQKEISIEALERHHVDYEIDQASPDWILIKRYLPKYERLILRKYTKRLRENRKRPPNQKLDVLRVDDDFSNDCSEGENFSCDEEETMKSPSKRAGSRNAMDWGGAFTAMKQELKKGYVHATSRKHTSPKKQQEGNMERDFGRTNVLDVERLGGKSSPTIEEINIRRGRRGLRQALHFLGLRSKTKGQVLSGTMRPEWDNREATNGEDLPESRFEKAELDQNGPGELTREREPSPPSLRPMSSHHSFNRRLESPLSSPEEAISLSLSADTGHIQSLEQERRQSPIPRSLRHRSHRDKRQRSSSPSNALSKAVVLFDGSYSTGMR
jgi:hypothetical protein